MELTAYNNKQMREMGWNVLAPHAFASQLTPDIVYHIFKWNCAGMPIKKIPHNLHRAYKFTTGSDSVRNLLQRTGLFKKMTALYCEVPQELIDIVDNRRFKKNNAPVKLSVDRSETLRLMQRCLEAWKAFQEAKADAIAAGVDDKTLRAWVKLTLEITE